MKRLILFVAAAGLLVLLFSFNAGAANACGGRFSCGDPQLCINSQLLTVIPTATSDTFVVVPDDAVVDFDVVNCGGTDTPVRPSHVLTGGNKIVVTVLTEPKAAVSASYGNQSLIKASPLGIDIFKFNLP